MRTIRKSMAVFAAVAMWASVAQADVLLEVDLLTTNEITITATGGLSDATVSGPDGTGVLFADFYTADGEALFDLGTAGGGAGDLTNVGNPSDGSPGIFRGGGGTDTGFNLWTWSSDTTVDFVTGTQAFSGSGTWTVTPAQYADLLAGNTSGDLYFPADTTDDIPGATLLGTWSVIPEPSSIAILSLGAIGLLRRRR